MVEVTVKQRALKVRVEGKIRKTTDSESKAEQFAGEAFNRGARLVEVIHTESSSVITTYIRKEPEQ